MEDRGAKQCRRQQQRAQTGNPGSAARNYRRHAQRERMLRHHFGDGLRGLVRLGAETADRQADGLRDGTIDMFSSDHAPHTREEKEVGWTQMWSSHTGTPGIQYFYPLALDAVNKIRAVERFIL